MKKILILLFIPFALFGQEDSTVVQNGKLVRYEGQVVKYVFATTPSGPTVPSHWGAVDSLWLIAESQYVTTDAFGVNNWEDISGQENDAVQATDARKPDYANDTVGFDGIEHAIASTFNISQPCVIYVVVNIQSYLGSARIYELNGSNAYFGFGVSQGAYSDSTEWRLYAGSFWNSGASGLIPLDEFILLRIAINGTSSEVQWNDHTPYTGDPGTNSLTEFDISDQGPGTTTHTEQAIKEVVILAGTETSGEQAASETYFNTKYSIW
jgi:hypothetical protein